MAGRKRTLGVMSLAWLLAGAANAQVRKLHTRDLTRLSQVQVADYLKRSDTVFYPRGRGGNEWNLPERSRLCVPARLAMTMAEETNSLYMPGLIWSYPGTTVVAPSTIYLPPNEGTSFLKILAKSLLRQGFRRQVWISAGQGPAALTVGTLVREFFDETHVPILYIDMDHYLLRRKPAVDYRSKVLYGSHYITGRMEDLPLQGEYGPAESKAAAPVPPNQGLATLGRLGLSGSLALGSWISDVMAHGESTPALAANAAEREEWGKQGKAAMMDVVKQMRLGEALEALRQHDRYTQEYIVPKLGKFLPGPMDHH